MKANDPRRQEVIEGITRLVESVFHGDYSACYKYYAGPNGSYGHSELKMLLHVAEIGSFITRNLYVAAIIDELDKDADGRITWEEFQAAFSPSAT